jgi:UDP-N-acetyl-2-amino-2-deoxyglucuronate dehydrogenase
MTRRIALVGLSWISADLAGPASDPTLGTAIPYSHASAVAAIPDLELVAGCDISATARETFAARWSPRYPGLTVYEDYAEMLRTERPELAAVVTPDHLHRGVVEAAIEAGVRGIFCEKPIATTLEDADAIVSSVRAAGVAMNVNYTRRWFPEIVEARRIVRSGEIGPLSQIVMQMGGPRSMLFRNHTHSLDLVNFLADSEPVWVWADFEPGYEDYGLEYAGDGGNDPATEPGGNYYVVFANGVRAYLTGMKGTIGLDTAVTLTGSEGRIVLDLEGIRIHSVHHEDIRTKPGVTTIRPVNPKWTIAGMQAGLQDLITSMDEGHETSSPPEQARTTVAVIQAILMSVARGNVPVRLDELAQTPGRAETTPAR